MLPLHEAARVSPFVLRKMKVEGGVYRSLFSGRFTATFRDTFNQPTSIMCRRRPARRARRGTGVTARVPGAWLHVFPSRSRRVWTVPQRNSPRKMPCISRHAPQNSPSKADIPHPGEQTPAERQVNSFAIANPCTKRFSSTLRSNPSNSTLWLRMCQVDLIKRLKTPTKWR